MTSPQSAFTAGDLIAVAPTHNPRMARAWAWRGQSAVSLLSFPTPGSYADRQVDTVPLDRPLNGVSDFEDVMRERLGEVPQHPGHRQRTRLMRVTDQGLLVVTAPEERGVYVRRPDVADPDRAWQSLDSHLAGPLAGADTWEQFDAEFGRLPAWALPTPRPGSAFTLSNLTQDLGPEIAAGPPPPRRQSPPQAGPSTWPGGPGHRQQPWGDRPGGQTFRR